MLVRLKVRGLGFVKANPSCKLTTLLLVYNTFLAAIVAPLMVLVAMEASSHRFTATLAALIAGVMFSPLAAAIPTIVVLKRVCLKGAEAT